MPIIDNRHIHLYMHANSQKIRIEKHLQCEKLLGLAGKHQKAWKQEIRREHA